MQNIPHNTFTQAQVDAIVRGRFQTPYGISTLAQYLDLIDQRTTAHLARQLKERVLRSAGEQRRNAIIRIADDRQLIVEIPMNDPRSGRTLWAITEFPLWLDLLELGANGKWLFNYKSKNGRGGQVRVKTPMRRGAEGLATVARVIVNAKAGQQARLHDSNPLNLRRSNLYLLGNPKGPEGKAGNAKKDTRAVLQEVAALRAALAGKNFSFSGDEEH